MEWFVFIRVWNYTFSKFKFILFLVLMFVPILPWRDLINVSFEVLQKYLMNWNDDSTVSSQHNQNFWWINILLKGLRLLSMNFSKVRIEHSGIGIVSIYWLQYGSLLPIHNINIYISQHHNSYILSIAYENCNYSNIKIFYKLRQQRLQ